MNVSFPGAFGFGVPMAAAALLVGSLLLGCSTTVPQEPIPPDDAPHEANSRAAPGDRVDEGEVVYGTLGAGLGSGEPEYPLLTYATPFHPGSYEAMRPRVMGTRGVVASGHYLATQAGYQILRAGGNAFDAEVATAMAVKALKMDYAGWVGVAPLILYSAEEDRVITRVGAGPSPALATLEHFLEHGWTPLARAIVPT